MPSSMLADGPDSAAGTSAAGFSATASRCATYSSTTPSTPRPKIIAAAPVAAADNVTPLNPSAPRTTTSDRADGSDPTATSQPLRNTKKSSGRISASDSTVFKMLSRRTNASVSTAMRWPPANPTASGGRGSASSAASLMPAGRWREAPAWLIDASISCRRASRARENSAS